MTDRTKVEYPCGICDKILHSESERRRHKIQAHEPKPRRSKFDAPFQIDNTSIDGGEVRKS